MVQKTEKSNEWTEFKNTVETRVLANENKIKSLKKITNLNSKVYKKIASLEKANYDLRKYIDEYIIEEKVRRDNFHKAKSLELQDLDSNMAHLELGQNK